MIKPSKPIKCRMCGELFIRRNPHRFCSPLCLRKHTDVLAAVVKKQLDREETAERKAKLKTRTDWLNEAQTVFNRYIRLRDATEPCISCGRFHTGKWNAGHYKTVKAHPELRFSEFNVHKQCEPCNSNLGGNVSKYRENLVRIFGEQMVSDELETHIKFDGWTIDDAKAIKTKYAAKIKALKAMQ